MHQLWHLPPFLCAIRTNSDLVRPILLYVFFPQKSVSVGIKLMALVIAGVMTISAASFSTALAEPAAVEAGSYDGTVSVTGTDAGDTLAFYKLVEWVDNAEGNVKGWKARTPYKDILTEEVLKEVLGVDTEATNITPALAAQLSAAAKNDTAVQSGTETSLNTTTSTDRGPGIYMALVTPIDTDTIYNPVFVSSDYNKDEAGTINISSDTYEDATVKKSKTTLTKTAKTSEDTWDDLKWNSTAIGDTVTFTVVTTLPGYGAAYTNPHFAVKDKLTALTLVAGSVEVTAPAGLTKGNQYTVVEGTDNYTLNFSADYLKSNTTPTQVTITYKALVATDAPLHVNTEKNEVSTEFSHTPSSEDDYSFKKDTTQHYTFTLDASGLGGGSTQSGKKTSELVKVGRNSDGTPIVSEKIYSEVYDKEYYQSPLAGAEFKLYTDADCTKEYIPKKADGTAGTALALTSGNDGRFEIKGLDAGTYYLKETKAPAGYVKDSEAHKIEIAVETDDNVSVTEYTKDGVEWLTQEQYDALADNTGYKSYTYTTEVLKKYTVKVDDQETATYNFTNKGTDAEIEWTEEPPVEKPFDIINTKGVELPSTGGIGTTIFYIVGAILVLGAGVLLVTRRRMSSVN